VLAAPLSDHEAVLEVLTSRYRSAQRSLSLPA
jgi:hypothetical protein